MKYTKKFYFSLVAFGVILYVVLNHIGPIFQALDAFMDLLMPVLIGLLAAFILNVPVSAVQKRLERTGHPMLKKYSVLIGMLVTVLGIALILLLAGVLLVPALRSSIASLGPLLDEKVPRLASDLKAVGLDSTQIQDWLSGSDSGSACNIGWSGMLGGLWHGVRSTVSRITSFLFGLIIAIYIIMSKQTLGPKIHRLFEAYTSPARYRQIYRLGHLAAKTYAKFLTGQCVEAVILGLMIWGVMFVFRLPYAALIGFLTALFSFIPYLGAFGSAAIGAFLIVLTSPEQAVLFVIVYLITQFVENQFVYPRVVGDSVGLSPLLTLVAALLGGKLFGLLGIIFFIPLTAFLYQLLTQDVQSRLVRDTTKVQKQEQSKPSNSQS